MEKRFEGKRALVIGGGRGMGRAIAERLATEGARVVVSARTAHYGEETVAALRAQGADAALVLGDISDRAAVKHMIDDAVRAMSGIDVLVHCAADNARGRVSEMADDDFDRLVRSNIHSLFWVAKYAAEHLEKSCDKGRLVYISSGSANRVFLPGLIPYASTKAFMNAFARGLAVEFGPRNILVNVIEPGMIASDRMKEHLTEAQYSAMSAGFPVPRVGESGEIAAAVAFIASPEASYITGTSLLVDGGSSMVSIPGLSKEMVEGGDKPH